jgi:hypothetical protein
MSIIGMQMVWFAILAKTYGMRLGILPKDGRIEQALRALTLERGIGIGLVLFIGGILLSVSAVRGWAIVGYGSLDPRDVMRTAIPSVTMLVTGMEFIVASFFLGLLRLDSSPPVESRTASAVVAASEYVARPNSPNG